MKKRLCLLFAALLLIGALAGCGQKSAKSRLTAENEIFTYEKLDPGRTQIVVSRTGNVPLSDFCKAFEAGNPDIQLVYLDITGGNNQYMPLVDWVTKGYAPDIVFSAADFFTSELTPQYFVNLSTDPIIGNYEAAALKRTAVNDEIYFLPGPSNINAMMYNKTLFEKYGWEAPHTFEEFIDLCEQIRLDTNGEVEPWNPNAKYSQELLTVLEGFTYEELFGGVENRTWYNNFIAGNGKFAGHMEPYMDVIQTLTDHKLLREEHFSYSATARGKEFAAGKIAMINMNIYDADSDEFDFGYMPFPTTKGEIGYLSDSYSCFVALPIKEHTEKEEDAIGRFLSFFSSPEGQQLYIGKSMMASNVKNVPLNQSEDLAVLQPVIEAGHMFDVLSFASASGVPLQIGLHQNALDIVTGAKTGAQCIAETDASTYATADAAEEKAPEIIASVQQDMTILETSFYIADLYREATGADIGLIPNNSAYRGNVMRLFSGDITPAIITVLKPRSFENGAALTKYSMTGQQILDTMNAPVGYDGVQNCIYAYSGLQCKVAPWNALGQKYLSIKLADGTPLAMDQLYTVGAWAGTVTDACITETLGAYEGTFEELMTAKMQKNGAVAPANDARIQLVWN